MFPIYSLTLSDIPLGDSTAAKQLKSRNATYPSSALDTYNSSGSSRSPLYNDPKSISHLLSRATTLKICCSIQLSVNYYYSRLVRRYGNCLLLCWAITHRQSEMKIGSNQKIADIVDKESLGESVKIKDKQKSIIFDKSVLLLRLLTSSTPQRAIRIHLKLLIFILMVVVIIR